MCSHVDQEQDKYVAAERFRAQRIFRWLYMNMEEPMADSTQLRSVTIQSPTQTGRNYRAVLKGVDEKGERFVAFCDGATPQDLMTSVMNEAETRGIPWRTDKPYDTPLVKKGVAELPGAVTKGKRTLVE